MGPVRVMISSLAALALATLAAAGAQAADLTITVKGIRSDQGAIMIGIYASAGGFANAIATSSEAGLLNDKGRLVGLSVRAKQGDQTFVVSPVPPGQYAVIVFHDENDDGRLDENGWGVPTEGYGFSNNASAFLSAPSFTDAAVDLNDVGGTITISLAYPITTSAADTLELEELLHGK